MFCGAIKWMSIKLYKHYDIFHLYRAKIIYIAFLFWEICKPEDFFSRISKENAKIIYWYRFFRLFARSHGLTRCNLKEGIRWVDQPLSHSHPKHSTQNQLIQVTVLPWKFKSNNSNRIFVTKKYWVLGHKTAPHKRIDHIFVDLQRLWFEWINGQARIFVFYQRQKS